MSDATDEDHTRVSELLERWHANSAFCFMVRGQLAKLLAEVRGEEQARNSNELERLRKVAEAARAVLRGYPSYPAWGALEHLHEALDALPLPKG